MEAVRIDAKKDESDTDLEDGDDEDLIDVLEPQSDSFEEDNIQSVMLKQLNKENLCALRVPPFIF